MNFFQKLFRSRKKNKYERDNFLEEQARTRYAGLDEERVVRSNPKDDAEAYKYAMELCEQMSSVSHELEDTRSEYQVVTNYLNDIQMLENLSDEQKAPILECAGRVASLDKERSEFLETERRLSETQFAQMQAVEDELPDIVRRLKVNEADLDKAKRNLSALEGAKLEYAMLKSDAEHRQKTLRKMSVYLLTIFATMAALFVILRFLLQQDTQIAMMVSAALAAVLAVYILIKYQEAGQDIKRADVNRNYTVTRENQEKIKYVYIKNAVDYTCEKYHVRDSRDLTYIYEQYQEEVREREKLCQTSNELEYYLQQLVKLLRELHFYDAQVWTNHANAIIDSREMVELKHDLITRRQKLRARVEYNINTLTDMKKETLKCVRGMGVNSPNAQLVIKRLEEIRVPG